MEPSSHESLTPSERLLLRARAFETLAVAFGYPDDSRRARLDALLDGLSGFADEAPGGAELLELRAAYAGSEPADVEATFNRLFSGAMDSVPFETAYERDIFRKQHALADIAGFYRAFRLDVPAASRMQVDHVGVELDFCAQVLARWAYAVDASLEDRAEACRDALAKFVEDHLGRFVDALAEAVASQDGGPFFVALANATRAVVGAEAATLGVTPDKLASRYVMSDDAALPTCGASSCDGCEPEAAPMPCPRPSGVVRLPVS